MPCARRLIQFVFVVLVLLSAGNALAADTTSVKFLSGKPLKSTTAAVFMSMGVPGLGQFYTRQYVKGIGAIVLEGSLLWAISYNNDRMMGARRSAMHWTPDSSRALSVQENPYAKMQHFFQNQRNRNIWYLAGSILLSMGDAYVDAQLYGVNFTPELSLSGDRVGVSVACKF
jgi:hypothetical protein